MIIVSVNRSNGMLKGYSVKGHAGYKPPGEDIVCAAVSVLAQTALLGLGNYVKKGLDYQIDDSGVLRCSLPDKLAETESIQAEAILETMVIGLKNLQKNYSKYIRVFRRRWTSC
ncbi:MAG: ribosomal-processing cysteine protease Prp [Firmicutes bacterium HGW-Firmicutes-14]|jgi:hypothetical protein|nr:MAG: ribosomal-processing cysteine protease Prp [Firmicutes bacterium HGW-Firmicutes-14]